MDPKQFWADVLAQNAAALPAWFQADAVINWHCSNERFTVAEFIRANCEYPGDWAGEVEQVRTLGEELITVVRVWPKGGAASFHVVSFFRLRDGRIAQADEYWSDDGPPPEWRQAMGIGRPIR